VLALALTQLLSNLNDLMAARKHVRWYALPLIWSATCFAMVTNYWWGMFYGVTGVHLAGTPRSSCCACCCRCPCS
jgi:hypothetical protein